MGKPVNKTLNLGQYAVGTSRPQVLYWPLVLLFILIVTPVLLIVGFETFLFISLLFFVLIWWTASRTKFPSDILYFTNPLLFILCIGLLGAWGQASYAVIKDVWYVSNAAMALIVGYVLMRNLRDLRRLFAVFIVAAFVVALLHLVRFAMNPELFSMGGLDVRKAAGGGPNEPVLALGLLLAARKMKMKVFGRHAWFTLLAASSFLASVYFAYSRTEIFSLAIILLAVLGWVHFKNNRKTILVIFAAVTIAFMATWLSPESRHLGEHATILDKFLFSFQELKIRDYYTMRDINENWRGYETSRALASYMRGNPMQLLFGGGFGATVDLGFFMPLGEPIRYLPVLHNGYMYLLVKTGPAGVVAYLWLLFRMARVGTVMSRVEHKEIKYCGHLIVGLGLAFLIDTYVVSGMFNKTALLSSSVLLGALLAYASNVLADKEAREKLPGLLAHRT